MRNIKNFRVFEGEEVKDKTIYVLIGPPSVGKSTWIKTKFGEIQPFVINRDDIVEKVAEEYGWTYDDLFSLPIKDIEKEGDKNEKYGTVIKSPAYMTWAPLSYDKVLEANGKIQDIFNKRIAEGKGKENIVVDMTNMNSGSRKGALKVIEGVEGEYHKVAVVFNFKGAEEIIKKMAAKRSEEMKAKGKSKTIPPAAFDRMFTSYDLQDDKGIPFDEEKIKDVLSKEGFDEVVSVDNTAELKRVIDESEKSVAENKNNMKYLKLFESFVNEELNPETYKRAAAGIRERDKKDLEQRKKLGLLPEYEEDFLLDKDGNLIKDEKGNPIRKADASAKNLEDHAKEIEARIKAEQGAKSEQEPQIEIPEELEVLRVEIGKTTTPNQIIELWNDCVLPDNMNDDSELVKFRDGFFYNKRGEKFPTDSILDEINYSLSDEQ